MATRVQVVFDCADPAALSGFWAEAVGYVIPAPPEPHASWDDWARSMGIPNPSGIAPGPSRIRRARCRATSSSRCRRARSPNRVHLDLNVGGGHTVPLEERRARVDAEVARLLALGATNERGAIERDGEYWVRMNDPEGNEFCVQ